MSPAEIGHEPSSPQAIRPVGSAITFGPSNRRSPIVGDRDHIRRHLILGDVEDSISRMGEPDFGHMRIVAWIVIGWATDAPRIQDQWAVGQLDQMRPGGCAPHRTTRA